MAHCDICNTELNGVSSIQISNVEFQRIVKNGFNPFARSISFGSGFTLVDVGFGSLLSTSVLYQNWKMQALASTTDWMLCDRCSRLAKLYSRKWWQFWKCWGNI
jgi:hypothetical protein